jgi:hypothetical protein
MTHPELVALIPTDEALGLNQPGDWKMPNPRVNEALHTATKGRILRNDRKFVADPANPDDPAIKGRLREDDLFIEYQVFGSTGG